MLEQVVRRQNKTAWWRLGLGLLFAQTWVSQTTLGQTGGAIFAQTESPRDAGKTAAPPAQVGKPAPGTAPAAVSAETEKNAQPLPVLSPPPADLFERKKWLEQRIDQLLALLLPGRNRLGIVVADLASANVLYAKNADLPLNIASNVKLFTTAAALTLLGPEYRFKTVLLGEHDRADKPGEWRNLYLRGYGDPFFSTEDLWKLGAELSARGIKRVKGDLVIDDSFFDEMRVGPAFEQKNQDASYRAPQGAVSLNGNVITVRVFPGFAETQAARVLLEPASAYFVLQNETRTVGKGRTSLFVEASEEKDAPPGKERTVVRVRGTIRVTETAGLDFFKRVAHPDLFTGYSLVELAARRGVTLAGKVLRGTTPPTAQVLGTHYSPPLGVIVRDVNKRSNNFTAEQILKTLGSDAAGKPGSWPKGLQAVSSYLETVGIKPGQYQMMNGSGLFDSNRFTAQQVVTLLSAAYRDFRISADFVGSLAVAGADGTIAHRMTGTAERFVRAKTGTLNGVTCLSGFAGGPAKPNQAPRVPLVFSILINEEDTVQAKRLQDGIVEALVVLQTGS